MGQPTTINCSVTRQSAGWVRDKPTERVRHGSLNRNTLRESRFGGEENRGLLEGSAKRHGSRPTVRLADTHRARPGACRCDSRLCSCEPPRNYLRVPYPL